MLKFFYITFFLLSIIISAYSQAIDSRITYMKKKVENGDTIYLYQYPQVVIIEKRVFKSKREKAKYTRLVYNVKKVYPYAKLAGEKLRAYNEILKKVKSEPEKKRIMKKAEDELKLQFEGEIRKLSYNQGKILIKLIDRETGATSYEIIKELRGVFTAFFWQQISRLFGSDLKMEYDPFNEDKEIEEIIVLIEQGYY